MTIEELEAACGQSRTLDFVRHPLEAPELTLRGVFYPLGFPTELRTNSAEVLAQARELWSVFEKQKRFDTPPVYVDVHVVEGNATECPPAPVFRMMQPLMLSYADQDNFSLINLNEGRTQISIARSTEQHKNYLAYFFLGGAPLLHISNRYVAPVHAACVSLKGRGLLLCGDSGAGKSTLAYACARAGWTYVTDDASLLLHDSLKRTVLGNCHQVRFRPAAAEFFPEIQGMEVTPRAAGKPSIELPTAPMKHMICAPSAEVDYLVFLNRREPGPPELRRYCKDVVRYFLRQVLYGSPESLAVQYDHLERLLTADVYELRYTDLDWAVERLARLAERGA